MPLRNSDIKLNSVITDNCSETSDDTAYHSDIKVLSVMTNIAHIVIGVAILQLGIVGTWYQRYMNFPKDQLRHVIYICVLFIILGVYGMVIVVKKLQAIRAQRIAYITLSSLSTIASSFIIANGIRLLLSDSYQTKQTVVVIFDGLMVGLSAIEVPVAFIALYSTVPTPKTVNQYSSTDEEGVRPLPKTPPTWSSIFGIMLNVAHIVLGLCITELGMVGMIYRNFMNVDSTGLFAIVFVSMSFTIVGVFGIYSQVTGKASVTCNRSMYTFACLVAVGCATVIMTFVSVAMSSKQYYTGIEAIVAFDVMILSMSSVELVVAVSATALCLVPLCFSKLRLGSSESESSSIQGKY